MKITTASLLTALIASADASSLRTEKGERKLQLASQILNALIDQFTPQISELIQDELDWFDPIDFGNQTTIDLGNSTFDGACPNSSANLTYGVGSMTGLSDLTTNSIQLVENTEDITVSFMALDGATWEGDWLMSFTLPNVTAQSWIRIEANLCGFPIDQRISGSTSITNLDIEARATMAGETKNAFQFRESSQVNSVDVTSVELAVGGVAANFGINGTVVRNLGIAETLEQTVLTQFANDIEPFVTNVVNAFLETNTPLSLADDATSVNKKGGN